MNIVHSYMKPRKHPEADCKTCRFAEKTSGIHGENTLLCTERMFDDKNFRCYLPREESENENS